MAGIIAIDRLIGSITEIVIILVTKVCTINFRKLAETIFVFDYLAQFPRRNRELKHYSNLFAVVLNCK